MKTKKKHISRKLVIFGMLGFLIITLTVIALFRLQEPDVQPNTQPEIPRVDSVSIERMDTLKR
jgi:hypothetical protein